MRCIRPRTESGFSIVELLVVVLTTGIIAMIAVPQLIRAFERSRQRGTLADMRSIAAASGTYRVDEGEYPGSFADLEPTYMSPVPPRDAWGNPWQFTSNRTTYELVSLGSDGATGPAPPADWVAEPFEADIELVNGTFVQAPDAPG